MSSTTLTAQSPGFSRIPEESFRQRSGRYATLAATVAIVLAVAFGGWLAMSQMPGGGGDGRFAALQGTPEVAQSQTCDVEPLTVDEVVAIVENPVSVAPADYWGTPTAEDGDIPLAGEGLSEWNGSVRIPESLNEVPDEAEFTRIRDAAASFYDCMFDGTVGQYMATLHPEQLQSRVLSNFPVYRDKESVRTFIEDVIDLPAIQVSPSFLQYPGQIQFIRAAATPDRNRVRIGNEPGTSLLVDKVAFVGLDTLDNDGNVIGQTDWDATLLEGDQEDNNGGQSLIMVYSEATDSWYYYGTNSPRG